MNKRIEKIISTLKNRNWDAFLITKRENVEYLSNFCGEGILLLIPEKTNLLITDPRFIQEAYSLKGFKTEITQEKMPKFLFSKFIKFRLKRVGFESNGLTYAQYQYLKEICDKKIELIPAHKVIERLRMLKDEEEINIIKEAINISILAFKSLLRQIKPGDSEKMIANRLEYLIKEKGGDSFAFNTIVVSGKNASYPHGVPSEKKWLPEEPLLIDWGARFRGYNCDLTRVIFSYKIDPLKKKTYKILQEIQKSAISIIKPGIEARKIDCLIRSRLRKHRLAKFFLHSTGHGIGKEVHEDPWISKNSKTVLRENMVFTIEPGIYKNEDYGMRIEDIIRVTKNGSEVLTKELRENIFIK